MDDIAFGNTLTFRQVYNLAKVYESAKLIQGSLCKVRAVLTCVQFKVERSALTQFKGINRIKFSRNSTIAIAKPLRNGMDGEDHSTRNCRF